MRSALVVIGAALMAGTAAGCVNVRVSQDKPLEVNLNVNIKQEVVVKLEKEVQELIENNPDVF